MKQAEYAQIDNYLDLYRYAGQICDEEWQNQILERLRALKDPVLKDEDSGLNVLQQTFNEINRQILDLYRQLRIHELELTSEVNDRLFNLKKKRVALGQQIDREKGYLHPRIFH